MGTATAGSSGVPGDPGALRGAAASFGGASGHLDGLAGDLSGAAPGTWSGPASVACLALCQVLGAQLGEGADAFRMVGLALRQLAEDIEAAQEKAAAALAAAADADAAADGLMLKSSILEEPEAPVALIGQLRGEAAAQRFLALEAREEAEAAALVAAGIFAQAAGMAPQPPPPPAPPEEEDDGGGGIGGFLSDRWDDVKSIPGALKDGYDDANEFIDDRQEDMTGLVHGLTGHLPGPLESMANGVYEWSPISPKWNIDFVQGVGDWGVGMVEAAPMLIRLTPQYGMIDPKGQREQQQQLADGLSYAWDHPGDTLKAATGWNHVENGEPGRMAGQAAPDVALAILTGGGSLATRSASTTSKVLNLADDVSDVTRVTRRLDDLPALTPEQQLAAREWRDTLATKQTPTSTAAGRYEIEQTGPLNYEMRAGDVKIDADGFRTIDATATRREARRLRDAEPVRAGLRDPGLRPPEDPRPVRERAAALPRRHREPRHAGARPRDRHERPARRTVLPGDAGQARHRGPGRRERRGAVSDLLVSPSSDTDWRLGPDEFTRMLRDRWPDAEITEFEDPEFLAALDFRVTLDDGKQVDGNLSRDGQVVGLDGDIPEAAELAAWVRSIVPPEQELIFYDQGYHFDVALTPAITPQEIVAGAG